MARGRRKSRDGAQPQHFIEDALGDFAFCHTRQGQLTIVARKKRYDVCFDVEADAFGGHVIGHDQIGVLRAELRARVFGNVVGLRRKTYDDALALYAGDICQNIRRGLE